MDLALAVRRATQARSPNITELVPLALLLERVLATQPWQRSPHIVSLQRAVRSLAADMRERGTTPEQMVIVLKQATARSAWRPITTEFDSLHYRMTLWGVREFFRCDL